MTIYCARNVIALKAGGAVAVRIFYQEQEAAGGIDVITCTAGRVYLCFTDDFTVTFTGHLTGWTKLRNIVHSTGWK